jgi:hypothetical protein
MGNAKGANRPGRARTVAEHVAARVQAEPGRGRRRHHARLRRHPLPYGNNGWKSAAEENASAALG